LVSKVVSNHNKLVKITKIGFDRSKMPNRFDVYELSVGLGTEHSQVYISNF